MVLRKTHWALLCLLLVCHHLSGQAQPKACPIYIAHEIHDGQIQSVSRTVSNKDCIMGAKAWMQLGATKQNDDRYTEVVLDQVERTQCLSFSDWQLNIPPGAKIHGLQADFYGHKEGDEVITTQVRLVGSGRQYLGRNQGAWAKMNDWPDGSVGSDGHWFYGHHNETWMANLTSDILNDPEFGIEVQVRIPTDDRPTTLRLDHVAITVFFTPLYTICHDSCTVFYVDEVPGALAYHWTLPDKAFFVSKDPNSNIVNLNVKDMDYGLHEICVQTISNQGISDHCCSTFRLAECQEGSIGDLIFQDNNNNGVQDVGEVGVEGVELILFESFSGNEVFRDTTDIQGNYRFNDLPEGYYYIEAVMPAGVRWSPFLATHTDLDSDWDESNGSNTSRTFYLPSGTDLTDIDGGLIASTTLGDFVWNDLNYNGIQDTLEPGLPQVDVQLLDDLGNTVQSTQTNQDGYYLFQNVGPGDYSIIFSIPQGSVPTVPDQGIDDQDSDVGSNGQTPAFNVSMGNQINNVDAGFFFFNKIKGLAWYDRNSDGLRGNSDEVAPGIITILSDDQGVEIQRQVTGQNGTYCFDSLTPGNYQIIFPELAAQNISPKDVGNDDTIDSDIDDQGQSDIITLSNGGVETIDAGYKQICDLLPAQLELTADPNCWDGNAQLINFQEISMPVIPTGFDHMYLLIEESTQMLIAGSNVPVFSVSAVGTYSIVSIVYEPNAASFEFLDLGRFINQNSLLSEIQATIDDHFLCAAIGPKHSFEIKECSAIQGVVWIDQNPDGQRAMNEDFLEGIEVKLLDDQGAELDVDSTDVNGHYAFNDLAEGDYYIELTLTPEMTTTLKDQGPDITDSDFNASGRTDVMTLGQGQILELDAGILLECNAFAGFWSVEDSTLNCLNGTPEKVELNEVFPSSIPSGYSLRFLLVDVGNGSIVEISNDPEFNVSQPGSYRIHALVFNPNPSSRDYYDLNLIQIGVTSAGEVLDYIVDNFICADLSAAAAFELVECGQISGIIFYDQDENDLISQPDLRREGVEVVLTDEVGNEIGRDVTLMDGSYRFNDLRPARYRVEAQHHSALIWVMQDVGMDDAIDSDLNANGRSTLINLTSGGRLTLDGGLKTECAIMADPLGMPALSQPCLSGPSINLSVGTTMSLVPSGFAQWFLLIDESTGVIINVDQQPTFTINTAGTYRVMSLVINTDVSSPEYFDRTRIVVNTTTVSDLEDMLELEFLCFDLNKIGRRVEINDCGMIDGMVWQDDQNGTREISETPFENVLINLLTAGNIVVDSRTTDDQGRYVFDDVVRGLYRIEVIPPTGWQFTGQDVGMDDTVDSDVSDAGISNTLILNWGQKATVDAGLNVSGSVVGDRVWEDLNGNGIQDAQEPGINGVEITLRDDQGVIVQSTQSATQNGIEGYYEFVNVPAHQYYISIENPQDYIITQAFQGVDVDLDSDLDDSFGPFTTAMINVLSNQSRTNIDLGLVKPAKLGDRLWFDENNNGLQDLGEVGINGQRIRLVDATGNIVDSVVTTSINGVDGSYCFEDVFPSEYYVELKASKGWISTLPFVGQDDQLDSDMNDENGPNTTPTFSVISGQNDLSIDLGWASSSCIGDRAWTEIATNGVQDFFERGRNDIGVVLFDALGNRIDSTFTSNNSNGDPGFYRFDRVAPGNYYIEFVYPQDIISTLPDQGNDDELDSDLTGANGLNTTDIFTISLGDSLKSIDVGFTETASIGNRAWCDDNANGLQDVGEAGINDIEVILFDDQGNALDTILTANDPSSGEAGYYSFNNLFPGAYYLSFGTAPDKVQTLANAGNDESLDSDVDNSNGFGTTSIFNLSPGENDRDVDAGYIDPGALLSEIGDYVWLDRDNDGIQDAFESGLNGVLVELYDTDDQRMGSVTTDYNPNTFAPGYYSFDDLKAGQYYLVFTPPAGYEYAKSFAGFDNEKDSDISNVKARGSTNILAIYAGEQKMSIDAGFVQYGSLGDYVWRDINANGIQDLPETGVNGVTITLYNRDDVEVAQTMTVNDDMGNPGYYVFEDIDPDGYYLKVDLPQGFAFTNAGGDDTKDSDVNNTNGFGTTSIINISPGEHDRDADIGIHKQGMIGRLAWFDDNRDGIKNGNEKGAKDIHVGLYNVQDSMYYETMTDEFGRYQFDRIPMGIYYVEFKLPGGYAFTSAGRGAEFEDSDVTHEFGYGTTGKMEIYPGQSYLMLDAGIVSQVALALELSSFEARAEDENAILQWSMNQELDISHYTVERKHENEVDFRAVGDVYQDGSRFGSYSFEDKMNEAGTYYYRIRINTATEEISYSAVRALEFKGRESHMSIYPNPTSNYVIVEWGNTKGTPPKVRIIALDSRVMLQKKINNSLDKIDVSDLPAGSYIIELDQGNGQWQRQMLQIIK